MVLVSSLLALLAVLPALHAAPLTTPNMNAAVYGRSTSPIIQFLCHLLPIGLQPDICNTKPKNSIDVSKGVQTPYGFANGTLNSGVVRFAVRYAGAPRWKAPTPVTVWQLPNNDPAAMPLACPQTDLNANQYSEDCLFLILYVPVMAVLNSSSVNTLLWIHGGSFRFGAATDPGLDGSKLALATGSIVATVQYRLGVLGFLPPSGLGSSINLGVKDITQSLAFLRAVLPSFGGNVDQITVAGQSSGAAMIRALLAAPTAASQFKNAILQSDPIFYNFLPNSAYKAFQTSFYSTLSCAPSNTACLTALPLSTLLSKQDDLYANASTIAPAGGPAQPLRPSVDGSFITTSLTGTSYPSTLKPLLITTVKDESGLSIGSSFDAGTPADYYEPVVDYTFGDNRTATLLASPYYSPSAMAALTPSNDQTRVALSLLGTDATWRCSSWTFARSYVSRGGKIWVGRFMEGATYPSDPPVSFCTQNGRVCHQDDIFITFGTTPSPTSAQATLTTEIQARWSSFMHSSIPNINPTGAWAPYAPWNQATTTNVHALQFGLGGGEAPDGACIPTFWGQQVQYDWQIYGVN